MQLHTTPPQLPYQFSRPTAPLGLTPSLVCGNRLEPRTRSAEFNRSLRAEVRDAAWLLARQWQMKEFEAEDRGSPVSVAIQLAHNTLNQVQLGDGPVTTYSADDLPLDALVQTQPPVVDLNLRLQLSTQFTRFVRRSALSDGALLPLLAALRQHFPLDRHADVAPATAPGYSLAFGLAHVQAEAYAVGEAVHDLTYDGYALLLAAASDEGNSFTSVIAQLIGGGNTGTGGGISDGSILRNQLTSFLAWFRRLYNQSEISSHQTGSASWSVADLAYKFRVAAPGTGGAVVLQAQEHLGDSLDWYALDATAGNDPANQAFSNDNTTPSSEDAFQLVPTEIQFTGAPNARWWEFEDRRVDFGKITADSSDLGRMLLQDFMFLYHNDWFSVPYAVPVGTVCTIEEVVVTDVFGRRYAIQSSGDSSAQEPETNVPIDNDWGRWSLFALSETEQRQQSRPRLLIPPTAASPLVGPVLEQVYLAREEATNLVWGVEQTISDGLGRGMDGSSAAARVSEYLRSRAHPVTPLATAAKLEFKLSSPTAENWIPFVPRQMENPPGTPAHLMLEEAEILRQVDGLVLAAPSAGVGVDERVVLPRTTILQQPDTQYLIHEREVPPVGVRLEGNYRRTRWFDGKTVTWYGRSRGAGRSSGSSGLAYDQLLPREARTTPASFVLTDCHFLSVNDASASQLALLQAGVFLIDRVLLSQSAATGSALAALDISREQLIRLLRQGDTVRIQNTQDELQLVTASAREYVQRASLISPLTNGDKLGTI